MGVINVEQGPRLRDLLARPIASAEQTVPLNGKTLHYVGSGKAAIALILEYLRATGEMPDKMAEVVVPAWIGNPVYHQVNWFGFPTLQAGPRAKVLMIYHQYGFPQDMDRLLDFAESRRLIVIEDCAHACASRYKDRLLGSMGRFALYSFSKFSFCYALGGVAHEEPEFARFVAERLAAASRPTRAFNNAFKVWYEFNSGRRAPLFPRTTGILLKMAYAVYGEGQHPSRRAIALWTAKKDAELELRRRRYALFRERTDSLGLCSHLEKDGVTPYVIPIRFAEDRMPALVAKLWDMGVKTSVNHFDFNRCLLEPDFRKVVLIALHGGLSESLFERVIEAARDVAGAGR